MRYLAWVIMALVFLITFILTKDLVLSFAAEMTAVFLMLIFAKHLFFGSSDDKE